MYYRNQDSRNWIVEPKWLFVQFMVEVPFLFPVDDQKADWQEVGSRALKRLSMKLWQ